MSPWVWFAASMLSLGFLIGWGCGMHFGRQEGADRIVDEMMRAEANSPTCDDAFAAPAARGRARLN